MSPPDQTHPPADADDARTRAAELAAARIHLEALIAHGGPSASSARPAQQPAHAFWSTQPVPQLPEGDSRDPSTDVGRPILTRNIADVSKTPLALIDMFEWCDVDVTDDKELQEAYRLLNLNYVEDGDAMFRFDYSPAFLRWALMPPGWHKDWHLGVRVKATGKLVALITAVPSSVTVRAPSTPMVEINFLCVHKKLRAKRLAPVLIQEVTRRVNARGVWQAVYTAGALLPRPVSSSRYYHRSLNPKKLIEVGFSRIAPRMTMARTIKLFALKPTTSTPGLRQMTTGDVPAVCKLLAAHMSQFEMRIDYDEADFAHWFLPRDGVVHSYVVEDPTSSEITDFTSFFSLPSTVMKNPKHSTLNAAYSFCNVATKADLTALMRDTLILAANLDFDVFNALDLAHNADFFDALKFHIGDGTLHWYCYNWQCRSIEKTQNALVLL
jgi:glycylpeptide N-tetradecanoyltransferase